MVAPMLMQIQTRLMQTEVWRYAGFASAVVGLLCYALSSSFNYLFGEWNLLKIFLFVVFSFITCVVILFAETWQQSRSHRFKAHIAFLVLTITSVYSFFFDKVVNGKPDAYSLISCAAFAIMSLSLSRQTQCGFEVDLLYFFLGCLIVQLMRIELPLGIVGVGFSYSLIILRSSFSSMDAAAPDNEYPGLPDDNLVVVDVDSLQLASTDIASSMMEQLSRPPAAAVNGSGYFQDAGPDAMLGNPYQQQQHQQYRRRRRQSEQTHTVLSQTTDDNHAWRKYGQKEILNSQFPRSYYRCIRKFDQGCRATKQVQRTEENPDMFQITYIGLHTCKPTLEAPQMVTYSDNNGDSSLVNSQSPESQGSN